MARLLQPLGDHMHARSLSVLLRRAMVAALAAPAVACGGVVDPGFDAGTDATPDGPPPGCNVTQIDGGSAGCGGFSLQLSGDVSKCNVSGATVSQETCTQLCGGAQYSYLSLIHISEPTRLLS